MTWMIKSMRIVVVFLMMTRVKAGPVVLLHDSWIYSVAIQETSQGVLVVTGSDDTTAKIWDPKSLWKLRFAQHVREYRSKVAAVKREIPGNM